MEIVVLVSQKLQIYVDICTIHIAHIYIVNRNVNVLLNLADQV